MPASIVAVIGSQSAPDARAWLPLETAPDPVTDQLVNAGLTFGACAVSRVVSVPANVSRTAIAPVSTVTVAAPLAPCVGVAVIVALPAPTAIALAVLIPSG